MDHTLRSKVLRCKKYNILGLRFSLWVSYWVCISEFGSSEPTAALRKAIIFFPRVPLHFWVGWDGDHRDWKVLQFRKKSWTKVSTIKKCYLLEKENPRRLSLACLSTTDLGEDNAMDFFHGVIFDIHWTLIKDWKIHQIYRFCCVLISEKCCVYSF